jgi:hypothetical protein
VAIHAVVAVALLLGALIQAVAAVVLWRRRRVPAWVAGVSVSLFVIVFLEVGARLQQVVLAARANWRRHLRLAGATGEQAGHPVADDRSAVVTVNYSSQLRRGVTRRDLLKLAAATGLAPWLLPGCSGVRPLPALLRSRGPLPPRFATHLPIPSALAVTREADGSDRCTLTLREGVQQILPDRTTLVWGGDGMFPCPTIEARSGRRLVLRLRNELPVPTVMHLHGGKTPAASDFSTPLRLGVRTRTHGPMRSAYLCLLSDKDPAANVVSPLCHQRLAVYRAGSKSSIGFPSGSST